MDYNYQYNYSTLYTPPHSPNGQTSPVLNPMEISFKNPLQNPEYNKLNINAKEYSPFMVKQPEIINYNMQVKKIISDIKVTNKLNIGYLKVTNQILEMIDAKINESTYIDYEVFELIRYLHIAAKTKYFGKLIRHSVNYLQNNKIYMTIDVDTELGQPNIYMKFNSNTNFLVGFMINNTKNKINEILTKISIKQKNFNQFYISFQEAEELVNILSDTVVEENFITSEIYDMYNMFSKLIECRNVFEKNHIHELNIINYRLLCILQSL